MQTAPTATKQVLSAQGDFPGHNRWRKLGDVAAACADVEFGRQPTSWQTTKFTLAINLKIAKALGIEVPPVPLIGADE